MMFQVFKPAAPTKQPSCGSTRRNPRWILNVTDTNGLVLDLVMEAGECGDMQVNRGMALPKME